MLSFQGGDSLPGNDGLRATRWMDELYTAPFFKKNVKNIDNFIHMYDIFGCVHLSLPFLIPSHFYLLFMSFFFFFKKERPPDF